MGVLCTRGCSCEVMVASKVEAPDDEGWSLRVESECTSGVRVESVFGGEGGGEKVRESESE